MKEYLMILAVIALMAVAQQDAFELGFKTGWAQTTGVYK